MLVPPSLLSNLGPTGLLLITISVTFVCFSYVLALLCTFGTFLFAPFIPVNNISFILSNYSYLYSP
jgi:hypothetical protein